MKKGISGSVKVQVMDNIVPSDINGANSLSDRTSLAGTADAIIPFKLRDFTTASRLSFRIMEVPISAYDIEEGNVARMCRTDRLDKRY